VIKFERKLVVRHSTECGLPINRHYTYCQWVHHSAVPISPTERPTPDNNRLALRPTPLDRECGVSTAILRNIK